MVETLRKYRQDAEKMSAEVASSEKTPSQSKKKRLKEAKRLEARIRAALDEGRIEEDIKGVKMEKVFSKASTKQSMVARVSVYNHTENDDFELRIIIAATSFGITS